MPENETPDSDLGDEDFAPLTPAEPSPELPPSLAPEPPSSKVKNRPRSIADALASVSANPSAAAESQFPGSPSGFDPAARAAFRQMARDYGPTLYRMPVSCEMHLRQYLAQFETERLALVEGLRREVPNKISEHPGGEGYEEYLLELAEKYSQAVGISREEAWWVVTAWATAIGKPVGVAPPPPVAQPIEPERPQRGIQTIDPNLRLAMTAISGLGGFLGAAIGSTITMAVLIFAFSAVDYEFAESEDEKPKAIELVTAALTLLIVGAFNGISGGIGGAVGWWLGRGDESPWSGFGAAFAAAFATSIVTSGCLRCCYIAPGIAAFGAAYTAASRGGYSH